MKMLLENCFVDKKLANGRPAGELILAPLHDCVLNGERVQKQTACIVFKGLFESYMNDESAFTSGSAIAFVGNGLKIGLTDCEFLMAIVSLLNAKSIEYVFHGAFVKCVPHFIKSIGVNMTGSNASNNNHRTMHLRASVTILTVVAHKAHGSRYAVEMIHAGHHDAVHAALDLLQR